MKYKTESEEKPCPLTDLIKALNSEIVIIESALETSRKMLEQIDILLNEDND